MTAETETKVTELENSLSHFTGTYDYHRHFTGLIYTDGIKYLAETAGAYWLIDAIASWQLNANVRKEEFQVWTLRCLDDLFSNRSGVLTVDDGNDTPNIVTQVIEYTDFPLDHIKLYCELGSLDGEHACFILMLPSER